MEKILITNNSQFIELSNIHYNKIYTDSPYVKEKFNEAIYLETLLDKNFDKTVNEVRKKGYKFNEKIIDIFFPKYKNRNINILDIQLDFTNVFINIVKLLKLIELNPNNEECLSKRTEVLVFIKESKPLDEKIEAQSSMSLMDVFDQKIGSQSTVKTFKSQDLETKLNSVLLAIKKRAKSHTLDA